MEKILGNDRGVVLVSALIMLGLLLAISAGGLSSTSLNLKLHKNFETSTSTFYTADSGIDHVLALIPPGLDFPYTTETQLVLDPDGADPTVAHPSPGFSYSVTALNSAGGSRATLTATANGPNDSRKILIAYVGRGNYGFGSIHAPGDADNVETSFSGDSFTINGIDRCGQAPDTAGLTTTDPALVEEITNDDLTDGGLSSEQMDNVVGAGGTPSVYALSPSYPTVADLAASYLALPHTELPGGNYSGNDYWGTDSSPRITRITDNAQISGTIVGYGALIVDRDLDISGNFTFNGLIIARGDISVQVSGNAGIYGSLLLDESLSYDPNLELDIRGNGVVQYDSCALQTADAWVPLPKKAKLLGWREKV